MSGLLGGRGAHDGVIPRENGSTTSAIGGVGNSAPSAEETLTTGAASASPEAAPDLRCEAWCWTHGRSGRRKG